MIVNYIKTQLQRSLEVIIKGHYCVCFNRSRYNLSVIEMVKHIARILKIKKNFYVIKNDSKNEIKNQRLNFKKITKELNWKQKVSLAEGLVRTVNWYKKNLSEFK